MGNSPSLLEHREGIANSNEMSSSRVILANSRERGEAVVLLGAAAAWHNYCHFGFWKKNMGFTVFQAKAINTLLKNTVGFQCKVCDLTDC